MKARTKITSPEEYLGENLVAISNLVEAKISHELNLINHRITWLASSQSFLFVAVATLLPSLSNKTHIAIQVFLFCISTLGIVISIQVLRGVHAAFNVLDSNLLPERADLVTELNRLTGASFSLLGPDRFTAIKGGVPAKWLPWTFMLAWLVVIGVVFWLTHVPSP
jgi:hypothetical protein